MSLPLATTTIAISRGRVADQYADPYEGGGAADRDTVDSGIRAVIDAPTGREYVAGGEQTVTTFRLLADPCDLRRTDVVVDERSSITYRVMWTLPYYNPFGNADHVEAGLELVEGLIA